MHWKRYLPMLLHPFQPQNIRSTLWIPGVLIWVMILIVLMGGAVATLFLWGAPVQPTYGVAGLWLLMALGPVLLVGVALLGTTFLGYQWRLIATLQVTDFQGTAPPWGGREWEKSFMAGVHFISYAAIIFCLFVLFETLLGDLTGFNRQNATLSTPVMGDFELMAYEDPQTIYPHLRNSVLWMVGLTLPVVVLLTPFVLGPLFYNAQHPSLGAVFSNLIPAWRWTFSRYPQVFSLAMLWQGWVITLVVLAMLIAGLSFIGILVLPFLAVGGMVLLNSLYMCAFAKPPQLEVSPIPANDTSI